MSDCATYGFLAEIDEEELRDGIRTVLVNLQLQSETSAAPLGRSSRDSERDNSPVKGRALSASECPSKDRSLFEHFAWRFAELVRKGDTRGRRLWFLLWEAENDHSRATVPPTEVERLERMSEWRENEESRDEEKLAEYIVTTRAGEHAFKVSLDMHVPKGWVEKIREDASCDPVYGNPRPKWRELDDGEKLDVVAEAAPGKTQRQVAEQLGVSLRTVKTFWPRDQRRVA